MPENLAGYKKALWYWSESAIIKDPKSDLFPQAGASLRWEICLGTTAIILGEPGVFALAAAARTHFDAIYLVRCFFTIPRYHAKTDSVDYDAAKMGIGFAHVDDLWLQNPLLEIPNSVRGGAGQNDENTASQE